MRDCIGGRDQVGPIWLDIEQWDLPSSPGAWRNRGSYEVLMASKRPDPTINNQRGPIVDLLSWGSIAWQQIPVRSFTAPIPMVPS